jgi:hypothetical protein
MDDRARPHEHPPLRVQLDLHLDDEPITGRLRTERGSDQEFVGWLGFVEALRRLSDAQTHERR